MYPYLRLHIAVRPLQGNSDLKAHLLRRVLGKGLIDSFCSFGRPLCQDRPPGTPPASATERCHVAGHCPYGVLFARSITQRPPFALFVFDDANADGARTIELSLYGPACALYSWALIALNRALDLGLGKERRRWTIESVHKICDNGRRRLCDTDLSRLPSKVEPEHFVLTSQTYQPPRALTVELLSPTRLIRDGRLLPKGQPVPFELLVARVLDRFRELYGQDASTLLRPDVRGGIEEAAAQVPLVHDETRWVEVKDYSARMRSELLLGGLTGRLHYDRPASRFLPILRAGEILHLGKNPTSGCGRLRLAS